MSNRSNEGRRPTKAERKEQARLEREALQRQMASRKRNRTIGMALVALAAVAVIAAVVVLRPGDTNAALPAPSELLDQAADEAQASACDAVQTTGFYDGFDQSSPEYADQAHVEGDERFPALPPLDTYASTPPASGPHTGSATLPAGVYGIAARPRHPAALAGARRHRRVVLARCAARADGRDRASSTSRATPSGRTA